MALEERDIFSELTAITKPIHRGKVRNLVLGENKSLKVGSGYEIHNIREWQPEDPLEHIDLDASLPTWPNKVYVLEMFEERNAPLVIVADISPSIFVGFNNRAGKFRLLLQSLGGLGLGANRFRDPVGFLCLSDKIEFYLSPKLGSGWVRYVSKLLHFQFCKFETLKKQGRKITLNYDLNLAIKFLTARLPRRQCSIVILSDFMDVIDGKVNLNYKIIRTLSARHNWNVIAIFLDEPEEFNWPHEFGLVKVVDIETGATNRIKAGRAAKIRHDFCSKREDLRQKLKDCGVDSAVLEYGDHFNKLAQFLSERKSATLI